MQRWIDSLACLIFPERCLFCRSALPSAEGRPLCSSCSEEFEPAGIICPSCTQSLSKRRLCQCPAEQHCIQALFALSFYEKKWSRLLHNLKYHQRRSLARPLGRWLGLEIIKRQFFLPDLVVPVPLHYSREKERGFNQSGLIAQSAALTMERPYGSILQKNRPTLSQTTLSRTGRLANVRGVFSVTGTVPRETKILLIDDIYSTGATMREAAKALHNSGLLVCGAVIAYNPLIK